MSEPITDRTAYRLECFIVDGVSQVSFSGFFDPTSSIEDKDKVIDELMAVAERQRAKHILLQVEAEQQANARVLAQEKDRLGKVLNEGEAQKANGGMQDATNNAIRAATQNVQRLENEDMKFQAKIEALQPLLRASG